MKQLKGRGIQLKRQLELPAEIEASS